MDHRRRRRRRAALDRRRRHRLPHGAAAADRRRQHALGALRRAGAGRGRRRAGGPRWRSSPRPARPDRRRLRRPRRSATVVEKPDPFAGKDAGQRAAPRRRLRPRPRRACGPTPSSSPASTPIPATRPCSACRATWRTCPSRRAARWHEAYPNGFTPSQEDEGLLNAVYRNGPAAHPDILGPTDNPGADWLKLGVGAGARPAHRLLRAGQHGRVQPARRRPRRHHGQHQLLGADQRRSRAPTCCPTTTSRPGRTSTWTADTPSSSPAAGTGSSDYLRMDRQRCAIDAIIEAANPVKVLAPVPADRRDRRGHRQDRHPAVGAGRLRRPGVQGQGRRRPQRRLRQKLIDPAYPDYDKMRADRAGRACIRRPPRPTVAPPPQRAGRPQRGGARVRPPAQNPVTDVGDACSVRPGSGAAGDRRRRAADQEGLSSARAEIAAAEGSEADDEQRHDGGGQPDRGRRRP